MIKNKKNILKINTEINLEQFMIKIMEQFPEDIFDNQTQIHTKYIDLLISESFQSMEGYKEKDIQYIRYDDYADLKEIDGVVWIFVYYFEDLYDCLILDSEDVVIGIKNMNELTSQESGLIDINTEPVMYTSHPSLNPSLIDYYQLIYDYNIFTRPQAKEICKLIKNQCSLVKFHISTVDTANAKIKKESRVKVYKITDLEDPSYKRYIMFKINEYSSTYKDEFDIILTKTVHHENSVKYIYKNNRISIADMKSRIFPALKIILKDILPKNPILKVCDYDRIKQEEI